MIQTGTVLEAKKGFRFEAMFGIAYLKKKGTHHFLTPELASRIWNFSFIRFAIPVLQFYLHHSSKGKRPEKALMVHRVLR